MPILSNTRIVLLLSCTLLIIGCSVSKTSVAEDEPVQNVDAYPTFPECEDVSKKDREAMFQCFFSTIQSFIAQNFVYPEKAKDEGHQGRAFISFIIEKDGSISSVSVTRSSGYGDIDDECVRVIQSLPECEAALVNEETVRSAYTIPISIKLK